MRVWLENCIIFVNANAMIKKALVYAAKDTVHQSTYVATLGILNI